MCGSVLISFFKSGDNVARYGLEGGGLPLLPRFLLFSHNYPTTPSVLISFFNLGTMWHGMGSRAGGSAFGWVVPFHQFLTIVLLSTFHSTFKPLRTYFMPVTMLQSMGSRAGGSAELPQFLTKVLLPFSHNYPICCVLISLTIDPKP